jgi:hypothetical protein
VQRQRPHQRLDQQADEPLAVGVEAEAVGVPDQLRDVAREDRRRASARLAERCRGYSSAMPTYQVNETAVKHARKLIDAGTYDDKTEWSQAAPSTDDTNKEIDKESFDEFAEWHLAVNPDASEGTKGRFAFPYGDFAKVNRAALIHAKQRAAQNDHDEIEKAADDLLGRLDRKRS